MGKETFLLCTFNFFIHLLSSLSSPTEETYSLNKLCARVLIWPLDEKAWIFQRLRFAAFSNLENFWIACQAAMENIGQEFINSLTIVCKVSTCVWPDLEFRVKSFGPESNVNWRRYMCAGLSHLYSPLREGKQGEIERLEVSTSTKERVCLQTPKQLIVFSCSKTKKIREG